MIITNLVVSVLVLTNGVAAGAQELELRPVWGQRSVTCNYCKGYESYLKQRDKYGNLAVLILPPQGECHCQYVPTRVEQYELVPWVEPQKKGGAK